MNIIKGTMILSLSCSLVACLAMGNHTNQIPTYNTDEILYQQQEIMLVNSVNNASDYYDEIRNGSILAIKNDDGSTNDVCEELGIPFSISSANSETDGEDIATLYYQYGDDLFGIYIINVGDNMSSDDIELLVEEGIQEISLRQRYSRMNGYTNYSAQSDEHTEAKIGTIQMVSVHKPYGKVTSVFDIYTIQDYWEEDYYIIKSTIFCFPGETLSETDADYGWQYVGNELDVSIVCPTTSTQVRSAGPPSAADVGTYTVNLGATLGFELSNEGIGAELGANLSWSWNGKGTTVSMGGNTDRRTWNVEIPSAVYGDVFQFVPGVIFVCPEEKSSIQLDIDIAYNINYFFINNESIVIDRTIQCTPTNASAS